MSDIYEQIADEIEADYSARKAALELLEPILKKPKPSNALEKMHKIVNEINLPPKRKSDPKLTIPCESKGCTHRVHAANHPCESCTKKVCAKCKKGNVCRECSLVGDR